MEKTVRTQEIAFRRAFTLIELLVIIAIIGILATLAVVALQQARSRARDSKRVADMKQIQTALELFYNENNRYPSEEEFIFGEALISSSTGSILMQKIPTAPTPADKDCDEYDNYYKYNVNNEYSDYSINFCIGKEVANLNKGLNVLKPSGIIKIFFCGVDELVDVDGNSYKTVQIGDQCWMAENLNTGIIIPNKIEDLPNYQENNNITEKYCYNNLEENCDIYGGLYQWAEAVQYINGVSNTLGSSIGNGDIQGICPNGWHVPSDEEVKILEMYIGMTREQADSTGLRGTDEGNKLMSCRQVASPYGNDCNTNNHPRWDFHESNYGLDTFIFSALPAGRVHSVDFIFADLGTRFVWRVSTPSSDTSSWLYNIFINATTLPGQKIGRFSNPKYIGASIRCLKD